MLENARKLLAQNLLILLILLVLATRIYPLIRGSITNLETLNTMLVIKQFAHGNTNIIFSESWLQVYLVTIPYSVLRGFLGVAQTMYVVKAALVVFSSIIVYFFGKELGGKNAGYFALLLFAVSPLAIYAQGLGVWSGDVIAPVFLSASILFMLYANANLGKKVFYLWAALSASFVILAYMSWDGGAYAIVTYMFALLLIGLQALIHDRPKVLLIGAVFIAIAFLLYIPSPYNIGVFSGGNYAGGISQTALQLFSNSDLSQYGSGAVTNPPDVSSAFAAFFPAGFFTSTVLILASLYFFLRKEKAISNARAFIAVTVMYLIATVIALSYRRFDSLDIIPIAILSGAGLNGILNKTKPNPKAFSFVRLVFAIFILIVLLGSVLQVLKAGYPTDLTNDYLSSMQWIAQYTPANATFLTNIFDEAPIIYYGNRQSALDGWNGGLWGRISANEINNFDNFLFAPKCNSTYINDTRANYLVVDKFWLYPGYIKQGNVNGTNMKTLVDGNFEIPCGDLTLSLVYNSGYNITKIYKIENSTHAAPNGPKELLRVNQESSILINNFTLVTAPTETHIGNNTYGEVDSGYERFAPKNGSDGLIASYILFKNFSYVASFYLSSIKDLKNSTNVSNTNVNELFNATYLYLNTTGNSESVIAAVYGDYFIYFRSNGFSFSPFQGKELLYNQISDLNHNCQAYNISNYYTNFTC